MIKAIQTGTVRKITVQIKLFVSADQNHRVVEKVLKVGQSRKDWCADAIPEEERRREG